MAQPTRRYQHLNVPFVDVAISTGTVATVAVYREDHLVDPAGNRFLVLDFATEMRSVTTVDPETFESTVEMQPTGRVALQIQHVDDNGEGLSHPVIKLLAEPPAPHVGRGVDFSLGEWHGWTVDRRSSRRPEMA